MDRKEGSAALRGGDLPEVLFEELRVEANHRIVPAKRSPREFVLTVAPATGLFGGSFIHPLTGKPVELQGALLQPQRLGVGLFLGPTNAGRVNFTFGLEGR
jgi:hypothetical protein